MYTEFFPQGPYSVNFYRDPVKDSSNNDVFLLQIQHFNKSVEGFRVSLYVAKDSLTTYDDAYKLLHNENVLEYLCTLKENTVVRVDNSDVFPRIVPISKANAPELADISVRKITTDKLRNFGYDNPHDLKTKADEVVFDLQSNREFMEMLDRRVNEAIERLVEIKNNREREAEL